MTIHRTDRFGFPILALTGDLTYTSFWSVLAAIREAAESRPRRVGLDLSEVRHIDPTGMTVLLTAADWLARRNAQLRILGVSAQVRELQRKAA